MSADHRNKKFLESRNPEVHLMAIMWIRLINTYFNDMTKLDDEVFAYIHLCGKLLQDLDLQKIVAAFSLSVALNVKGQAISFWR